MAKMFFAQDGSYGDAENIVILDLEDLGFPVPSDIYDCIPSGEMPDLFMAFIEHARVIRVMRSLLDKDDPAENEEYFRAMVETLQELLPTDGDTALSIAEAILSAEGER